jgi:MFS family permease
MEADTCASEADQGSVWLRFNQRRCSKSTREERRAICSAEVSDTTRAGVIAVCVRDHSTRNRRPGIDVEVAVGTIESGGRFGEHLSQSCTIERMAATSPPSLLRSLRHRNFRLFVSGQSVSLVGTWVTRLATSWLVYRLTDSEFLLGLVGFCSQIPMLFLGPLAGVYVDRWDRQRVLLWTQVLSLVQSALLGVLALAGVITVWQVLVLQLVQGVISAFETPARQAFVVRMLDDPADLSNAIALNSSMVNGSRIIGPAIGGVLIAAVGEAWCFVLDAISYVPVIWSLMAMRVARQELPPTTESVIQQIVVGYRYIKSFSPIRTALILIAATGTFGVPHSVLMPVMASDVLGGQSNTLGILMAVSGVGALGGALYLASRATVVGLGRTIGYSTIAFGVTLIAFAFSKNLMLSVGLLLVSGAGYMTAIAASNTLIQTLVDDHLRGRVMAFYTMAFLGTMPLGSLAAGVVAGWMDAPRTIALGGIACAVTGIWFMTRLPTLRTVVSPIYIERGILTP